jgi:hypothetical protein
MNYPIRTVRLFPYLKGRGPSFTLRTFDTNTRDSRGCTRIAYTLTMHEGRKATVLFDGVDFCPSPMYADDSDKAIAALLGFLTLRPGDTDEDYFADYTPEQLAYCDLHAETLLCYVYDRFGED